MEITYTSARRVVLGIKPAGKLFTFDEQYPSIYIWHIEYE